MANKKSKEEAPPEEPIPVSIEDLRGKTPQQLVNMVDLLDAHCRALYQEEDGSLRSMSDDEQKAFDSGMEIRERAAKMIEDHQRVSDIFKRRPKAVETIYSTIQFGPAAPGDDVRRMTNNEARDKALHLLDDKRSHSLRADQVDQVADFIRKDPKMARRALLTEHDDYRSGWQKLVTQPHPLFTNEERDALLAFQEYERAAAESPTSAGGFGIPIFIDPSIILTAQGTVNPFLQLARQVTVNTNVWKGISSAGVTWSFDAEASAVSDDAATLAQPTVTVFMARGFIPYSIELGDATIGDYPNFASEMATLLASGYDELLIDKLTRGSGSGEPQGLLTALSANTNVRVKVQTAGQFGANDPYSAWAALPQRFQRNANWLMSVATNNSIRKLATANVYHAYTVNLPARAADTLFESPVSLDPYMPDQTAFTTTVEGIAVVGDFSNYVIARRGGMSVELVPTLFDVTNNRPTGQRGWFAYARIGGGSANDLGFRLLVNS